MANNNDDWNRNRNRERPEDNPFIAFRRFADSQVSSLLNTVFTLPATIANYNNVHQAREACLFKKADKSQCDKLQKLEDDIAELRHEGRELYRVGDLQQVLRKSEELMRLDRHADELRRDIITQSSGPDTSEDERDLVHRVANRKGQEWGWDWSWGFPKPFDDGNQSSRHTSAETSARNQGDEQDSFERFMQDTMYMFGADAVTKAIETVSGASDSSPILREMIGEKNWDDFQQFLEEASRKSRYETEKWQRIQGSDTSSNTTADRYSPHALEADQELQKAGVDWRKAYNELQHVGQKDNEATSCPWREHRRAMHPFPKRVPWADEDTNDEPSYEYSHDHEDQHDDPPTPKVKQDGFQSSLERSRHVTNGQELWKDDKRQHDSSEQQQQSGVHVGLRSSGSFRLFGSATSEKTDDPSARTDTELDVYEQFMAQPESSETVPSAMTSNTNSDTKPSILSTLTTTERTVGPDGSVTTKVVLKKRFADGREESSETVHTQRGKEWEAAADQFKPKDSEKEQEDKKTRGKGWFWSS